MYHCRDCWPAPIRFRELGCLVDSAVDWSSWSSTRRYCFARDWAVSRLIFDVGWISWLDFRLMGSSLGCLYKLLEVAVVDTEFFRESSCIRRRMCVGLISEEVLIDHRKLSADSTLDHIWSSASGFCCNLFLFRFAWTCSSSYIRSEFEAQCPVWLSWDGLVVISLFLF